LTFSVFIVKVELVRNKPQIKPTETNEILNWLALYGPAAADELAGHILAASTKSAGLMAQHLRKLRKAGLVEPVDGSERPLKWKTCRGALPPARILPFPVALAQLKKAA